MRLLNRWLGGFADFENNVPTEQHLKELLTTAIELEANVSEIERERNKASEQLDAVWSRIHQAIVNEAELKRKRATIQQLNNDFSSQGNCYLADKIKLVA